MAVITAGGAGREKMETTWVSASATPPFCFSHPDDPVRSSKPVQPIPLALRTGGCFSNSETQAASEQPQPSTSSMSDVGTLEFKSFHLLHFFAVLSRLASLGLPS
jgi:hypothetical protein